MKIHEYNEMMAYLMRPKPKMQVADLVDDLEPGSLKDELLKDFDPSQETYEEYLQRKSLDRPFNAQDGGRAKLAFGALPFIPTAVTAARPFVGPLLRKGAEALTGIAAGTRLGDIFFSKDQDDKKDIIPSDDKNNIIPPEFDPKDPKFVENVIEGALTLKEIKDTDFSYSGIS